MDRTDPPSAVLLPATEEDITDALSYALRYRGRSRVSTADGLMARVTAERLVEHLRRAGFVLMRRPAAEAPTASHHGNRPS